jgi:hypothetical protein
VRGSGADRRRYAGVTMFTGVVPSGHDAWVVGDGPVVVVDWHGAMDCAKASDSEDQQLRWVELLWRELGPGGPDPAAGHTE